MGLYDIDKAEEIIGVPEGQLLMALVAVGYPDEEPGVPKKKTVDDLLSYRQSFTIFYALHLFLGGKTR